MKYFWRYGRLFLLAVIFCAVCSGVRAITLSTPEQISLERPAIAQLSPKVSPEDAASKGIALSQVGTSQAYFTYHNAPLLSFGGLSDFTFYANSDAFDYQLWADWAAEHGMNHLRAYPPFSWKYVENFAQENGGDVENVLFPYKETSPGSRQFDLTQFDDAYWARFRAQCEYLQSKGIIIHLLMMNGWQLRTEEKNWGGHFFNPENNVNGFTDVLAGNRLGFYKSVDLQQSELVAAQQAWLKKIVDTTADLDNVYYDLVHEIAENYEDWSAMQAWIEKMAATVRSRFAERQPDRDIILGMDTGGLKGSQRHWIFDRPYFDVLIYGKAHRVNQAKSWRNRYKKPYIPQEAWDENGDKYGFREPDTRVHLRKYLWKYMMAKCQQMDVYIKPRRDEQLPGFDHNYDPNGWNPFEDDALILRETWDRLTDYPNLTFSGAVRSGPAEKDYVLSSTKEALVYLSSDVGDKNVSYGADKLALKDLALADGQYIAELISPEQGMVATITAIVSSGRSEIETPAFTDDLAVHLRVDTTAPSQAAIPEIAGTRSSASGITSSRLWLLLGSVVGLSSLVLLSRKLRRG